MITPNRLTILRLFIAVACPPILILSSALSTDYVAVALFTAACITDWWDGHLARKKAMVTSTGAILDPIADKLLILGLMGTFSYLGLYGIEWIVLIAAREILVTWTRFMLLVRGRVVSAEGMGKLKVGIQIVSIYFSFIFLIAGDIYGEWGRGEAALPFFEMLHFIGIALANVITVVSGATFFYRLRKA